MHVLKLFYKTLKLREAGGSGGQKILQYLSHYAENHIYLVFE